MDIRRELRIAERLYTQLYPGTQVLVVDSFSNWLRSHFGRMHDNMQSWVESYLVMIEQTWRNDLTQQGTYIRQTVTTLRNMAINTVVD
jgi:hypothetical protein